MRAIRPNSFYLGILPGLLGSVLLMSSFSPVTAAPVKAPSKKVPDEAKLREVERLKEEYERFYGEAKYSEATALAERACAILGKERGGESVEVAQCFNDLAMLYYVQGEYEKAEPLGERALAIREEALGPDHPDVALSLNKLATSSAKPSTSAT